MSESRVAEKIKKKRREKSVKMIETADLQAFIEKIQGGIIPVDLLKIGQTHYAQSGGNACE